MAFSNIWGRSPCCNPTPRIGHDPSAQKLYATIKIDGYWYSTKPMLLNADGSDAIVMDFFGDFSRLTYRYRIFTGPVDICKKTMLLITSEDIVPRVSCEETQQFFNVRRVLIRNGKTLWMIRGCV